MSCTNSLLPLAIACTIDQLISCPSHVRTVRRDIARDCSSPSPSTAQPSPVQCSAARVDDSSDRAEACIYGSHYDAHPDHLGQWWQSADSWIRYLVTSSQLLAVAAWDHRYHGARHICCKLMWALLFLRQPCEIMLSYYDFVLMHACSTAHLQQLAGQLTIAMAYE